MGHIRVLGNLGSTDAFASTSSPHRRSFVERSRFRVVAVVRPHRLDEVMCWSGPDHSRAGQKVREPRQLIQAARAHAFVGGAIDDGEPRIVGQVWPRPPARLEAHVIALWSGQDLDDGAAPAAL